MRLAVVTLLLAVILSQVSGIAVAERAPEEKNAATHVVVGTVEGVYVRQRNQYRYYVVEIAVETVEKGTGLKKGQTIYARCYQYNADYYKGKKLSEKEEKRIALEWSSYDSVPSEGKKVRVYLKNNSGKYDGIYPDWYKVISKE